MSSDGCQVCLLSYQAISIIYDSYGGRFASKFRNPRTIKPSQMVSSTSKYPEFANPDSFL
jgi:hypothetical protein